MWAGPSSLIALVARPGYLSTLRARRGRGRLRAVKVCAAAGAAAAAAAGAARCVAPEVAVRAVGRAAPRVGRYLRVYEALHAQSSRHATHATQIEVKIFN